MSEFDLPTQSHNGRAPAPKSVQLDDAWLQSCVQVLQADGVSLLMRIDGRWHNIASTDETATNINTVQMVTGQGPGVQALLTGLPVQVPDWAHDAHHWPLFSAGHGTETIGALFALPLQSDDHDDSATDGSATLGVLHVYRRTPGMLNAQALDAIWLAAEIAATAATHSRSAAGGEEPVDLNSSLSRHRAGSHRE